MTVSSIWTSSFVRALAGQFGTTGDPTVLRSLGQFVPMTAPGRSGPRVEDRTGDTSYTQRRRQRVDPPHILLTTPESLALLLSYEEAPRIFANLGRVIVDEVHALAESKRGDQLVLALARLR